MTKERATILENMIWKVLSDKVTFAQRYEGDEGRSYAEVLEEKCME